MEKLTPAETGSFLAHCLELPEDTLPVELIEYVHRVSAGALQYVAYTARQLYHHGALSIEAIYSSCNDSDSDLDSQPALLSVVSSNSGEDNEDWDLGTSIFFSCNSILITYRFEAISSKVAQLRGCHIKRDLFFNKGFWMLKKRLRRITDSVEPPEITEAKVLASLEKGIIDLKTSQHINEINSIDISREVPGDK